jgi:hypothetical protein
MTLEFLLIICLPLLGFSGDPLSYEANFDNERAYHRQMAYKILAQVDPKRACNNLVYLEENISIWLNLPQFDIKDGNETISVRDHCAQLEKFVIPDTSMQLEACLETGSEAWFEQVYTPTQSKHRHIVIAIAGFLSETQDLKNHNWYCLNNYCRVRNIPLYVVRWEARSEDDVY